MTTRPAILDKKAARLVDREHITSSSEFKAFVEEQAREAQRRIDDRRSEISHLEVQIARSKADHETLAQRLDAEIRSRRDLNADDQEIIERAEFALTLDLSANRPAPAVSARKEESE